MFKLLTRRLAEMLPVLFIIITVTFFMIRGVPGSPFSSEKLSEEALARMEAHWGLDKPLSAQYLDYLRGLAQGELGPSFKHPGWHVQELIGDRLGVSLELGAWALLVALSVGILAGLIAALRPNSIGDHLTMGLAMLGICLPTFVLGPLMVLLFGLKLEWFNVWGWILPQDRVLPALTLGLYYAAYIARLMRASMVEVRSHDYMRTARAKGLPFWRVYGVHGLRNALTPVVSFLGPAAAGLLTGSFVVETIFQIPGLGQLFVESALDKDYNLLLGLVIFYATLIILFNLLVDVLLAVLNPRIRDHASS